jgi:hypothetical protein
VAHRTVWCAHRQQSSPTAVLVVGAINTPQPPLFKTSKHSLLFIQYKSNTQHSKTQIKASDQIKVHNSTLVFRTCEKISLCSFVVLVAWLAFFFLSFLLSKTCKRRRRIKKSLHQVDSPSTPPSSTTRRYHSLLRAFAKSSSKGGGRTTSPAPRKFAISVVSPVISLLNVHYQVIVTGATTRREEGRRKEVLQEEGRRCPCLSGVGLQRELHRLLLRRGHRKHRHQQGSSLPQRRPQVPHGKGWQKEGKI